jgi:hypothetical protein
MIKLDSPIESGILTSQSPVRQDNPGHWLHSLTLQRMQILARLAWWLLIKHPGLIRVNAANLTVLCIRDNFNHAL